MNVPKEHLKEILALGVAAGSVHNLQPWRFEIEGEALHLIDPHRFHFPLNIDNIPILLTMGCALENIAIAATRFGYRPEIAVFPEDRNDYFVAAIRFVEDPHAQADPLYPQIRRRRTNRLPYERSPVEPAKVEALTRFLSAQPNMAFDLVSDPYRKHWIHQLLMETERISWTNPETRRALLQPMLSPAGGPEEMADALGLSPFQKRFLTFIAKTPWADRIHPGAFSPLASAKKMIARTSHVGLVSIEKASPADTVQAGRTIQRMWLLLTEMDVDIQPMCDILSLMMIYKLKMDSFLSQRERRALKGITEQFDRLFGPGTGFRRTALFLFRMGQRAKDALPASPRRDLSSFLENRCRSTLGYDPA